MICVYFEPFSLFLMKSFYTDNPAILIFIAEQIPLSTGIFRKTILKNPGIAGSIGYRQLWNS
jgi:hypothetical protein